MRLCSCHHHEGSVIYSVKALVGLSLHGEIIEQVARFIVTHETLNRISNVSHASHLNVLSFSHQRSNFISPLKDNLSELSISIIIVVEPII